MAIFLCPPCGCESPHSLFKIQYSDEFKSSFTIYECDKCGTKRMHPFLTEKQIRDYYVDEEIVGEGKYRKWRKKYRYIHNWINQVIPLRKFKVIEIGSNSGNLLRHFKEQSQCEVLGIELSEKCKAYSENVNNVPVFNGNLDDFLSHHRQKADLILMVHLFEHLTDPDDSLEKLASIIKENGFVYVEIPNSNAIEIHLLKDISNVMCVPFHPYFYNMESLCNLLEKHNFRVIKKRYWSRKEDGGSITNSLATYCRYKINIFFRNNLLGKLLGKVIKALIRFYPNRHLLGYFFSRMNKSGSIAVLAKKCSGDLDPEACS